MTYTKVKQINSTSLRFGANYIPSKDWLYSWMDRDAVAVQNDLKAIATLGLDHLRVHLLWTYFQPDADYVSEIALQRLYELLEMADGCGLDCVVCVLNGWMSGFTFRPHWQKNRNMFTDARMIEAEKYLFQIIAERVGEHPRFLGFDLGNELGVLQHLGETVTSHQADVWQAEMVAYCQSLVPNRVVVNGVDHLHWFKDIGFSRHALANIGTLTSLHTWVYFTGALERYGTTGIGARHVAEYCVELAKAYQQDPERLLWVQEFGASTKWMPFEMIPDFSEATIRSIVGCDHIWDLTWWCSHDLNPKFSMFDPVEYDLGLLDYHNQVKPVGRRIADLIAEFRANPPQPALRTTALVLPENLFNTDQREPRLWQFIDRYMDWIAQGTQPAIVLDSKAQDSAYLTRRGITELVKF